MLLFLPIILFLLFLQIVPIILSKNFFTKLNDNSTATLLTKKHNLQGNAFVGVK